MSDRTLPASVLLSAFTPAPAVQPSCLLHTEGGGACNTLCVAVIVFPTSSLCYDVVTGFTSVLVSQQVVV